MHFRYSFLSAMCAVILVGGCASTHNLKTDGKSYFGGGFSENKIRPGFYQLTARSNKALWPTFSAARSTWAGRADELCGKDAYEELDMSVDAGDQGAQWAPGFMMSNVYVPGREFHEFDTTLSGYIVCRSSGLTVAGAKQILKERNEQAAVDLKQEQQSALEKYIKVDCNDQKSSVNSEALLGKGKVLFGLNRYEEAMSCFFRAQQSVENPSVFRESCGLIATMYELGWGVPVDLEAAKTWREKAGLR